jgi:hypothetical protein
MQHQFSVFERFPTAPNPLGLNLITCFPQPAVVDENYRQTANIRGFFDRIACRARDGGDNSAVVTQQLVQQARFARFGAPDDGTANATAKDLTLHSRSALTRP